MICNQFSPFFPVLYCPLGLAELQACPFLDVVFPPLTSSFVRLVFFPLSLCLARWFWPDLTIPLQFASLYACESWTLTAELQRRIQAMEMRCYRTILHISYKDHVTIEEVHAKIQQAIGPHEDDLTIVKRCKLQWSCHVSCSSGLAKTILQGTVKGGRRKGRGGKTA